MVCPSNAYDAARLLREAIRLAYEEQRVVVFIEPIALYSVKDLHDEGDGLMRAKLSETHDETSLDEVAIFGEDKDCDVAIVTYGNGAFMARRCAKRLSEKGVTARVIDLRWLLPLPMDAILKAAENSKTILIVDECRKTGSIAEELMARFSEAGVPQDVSRINGEDCFIPLGPAANEVLISEQKIEDAVMKMVPRKP